ncbi:MAG: diacylglycerol kinase family protein [Flavobacteriaceae bacterium]|nr:diacylglycerol kinase family protein [Flavobacteriaceae bacterium]
MKKFIVGRIKSVKFAVKGAFILLSTEHAIISQVSVGILMTVVGFMVGISKIEWIMQIFAIGLVLTAEGLNTAIEAICDFIHPDYHEKIGFIKDISAGAVTFAATTAFFVAILIYFPYIF